MKDFIKGLSYNIIGLKYFLSEKKLWLFVILPALINLLALILLISLYFTYFNDLFHWVTSPLHYFDIAQPSGFLAHLSDALLWFVRHLFMMIFFLLSVVSIFLVVFFLSNIVNSPFYELLSEKILILKGVRASQPFSFKTMFFEALHSLQIELLRWCGYVSVSVLLLLLSWIPAVGPFFSFLGFFFTAWFLAFGFCTFPMVINHKSLKQVVQWALTKKMLLSGFGLPSLIPFVGLFIAPIQIVGGTLLYLERE